MNNFSLDFFGTGFISIRLEKEGRNWRGSFNCRKDKEVEAIRKLLKDNKMKLFIPAVDDFAAKFPPLKGDDENEDNAQPAATN